MTVTVSPWYRLSGEAMFEALKREGFDYQQIQTLREIDPKTLTTMKAHGEKYNTTFIRTMGFFLTQGNL